MSAGRVSTRSVVTASPTKTVHVLDQMPSTPQKRVARRRRIRSEAAKRAARVKIQKTDRKQTIRQVGRRRGGR